MNASLNLKSICFCAFLCLLTGNVARADSGGPQQVFYVGVDKHIYHHFASPAVTPWYIEDVTIAASAPLAESTLTSYEDSRDYSQHVFYISQNAHIQHLHAFPGRPWMVEDLTSRTSSPNAASSLHGFHNFWHDSNQLFYVGADSHLYHLFSIRDVGWGYEDLTQLTNAPLAQPGITSFNDVWYDSQIVFFAGANGHVYEVFENPQTAWFAIDLYASVGAVPCASGLDGFVNPQNNSQSVFYVGTDQHIHRLFAVPGQSFSTEDLTALAGTGNARPQALTTFVNHLNEAEQVYYIGIDQHVYHLYARPGSRWAGEDITAQTGAPLAASSLASFHDVWHNAEQVFFVGLNGHVYHFFAPAGGTWHLEDLTAATGGMLATLSPDSLNSWVVDQNQILIGGQVIRRGAFVAGATINLSGSGLLATTTDANGRFLFKVPMGGTYVVSVTATDARFDPASKSLERVRLNQVVNFVARGGGSLAATSPATEYIWFGERIIALEQ